MGILTPFFNLFKPAKTDPQAIAKINDDLDIIDTEMHRPPLTVNGIAPDSTTRNLYLETVPLADNLSSDEAQLNTGTFIERSSGGASSIASGDASLVSIKGNIVKTGYVAESIDMTVTAAEREEGVEPITATLDRDTFVAEANTAGTYTFTYTTQWSVDPSTYGITVTGTPINGDVISVVYVMENRGTITPANPTAFNSTGWNLYNNSDGYAKVVKYSDEYNFLVGGTYSLLEFSETLTGTKSGITVVDGLFSVPSDGYVFVTGGSTDTYILMTWSDWTEGYPGDFETYSVDTISLSEAMLNFPYGLLAVGNVRDEINVNIQRAINRVERLAYTAENLAAVIASGVAYDTDTNYIYAVLETPISTAITIDGTYTVSDHGIEYFSGTSVAVIVETLYGQNLKDKLRRDVLTISAQELNATQKAQVLTNIGGASVADITALNTQLGTLKLTNLGVLSGGKTATITASRVASTLIFVTGVSVNVSAAWMVLFRSGNNPNAVVELASAGQYITMNAGTSSSLTIANTSSQNVNVNVINIGADTATYTMTQA